VDEMARRFKRLLPAGDLQFASLAMERAQITMARGDAAGALAEADRAVALCLASPNRANYLRRQLVRRSALNLAAARFEAAAADAQQAVDLELKAAVPDTLSSTVGQAYLALARALAAQGKTAEAQRAGAAAHVHLSSSLGEEHGDTAAARRIAGPSA
jgi:tetratricopeptide (TPR) repeat protein